MQSTVRPRSAILPTATSLPMPYRLTFDGIVLFGIGLLIAASGFRALRVEVGSLQVHPYLFVLAPIFPLMVVSRLLELPTRLLFGMGVFACLYFTSTFVGGVSLSEGLKIGAALATIVTTALLVNTRTNFTAGVLGFCIAAATLAILGVEADEFTPGLGKNAVDIANRNAYSLYALPAVLLACFELIYNRRHSLLLRLIFLTCIAFSVGGIIISLNRSGWLCTVLIGLMLFLDRNIRGKWLIALAGVAALALAYYVYDPSYIERRFLQTIEDPERDIIRWQLIKASLEIGMDNPIFGVSPQELPVELASKLGWDSGYVLAHNVFAHLIGGCGFFCTIVLIYIGAVLWTWPLTRRPLPSMEREFAQAVKLMRWMIFLWVVRGMFTHEILYSPGFCMGLGLCIGLCIVASPRVQLTAHRPRYSTAPTAVLPT